MEEEIIKILESYGLLRAYTDVADDISDSDLAKIADEIKSVKVNRFDALVRQGDTPADVCEWEYTKDIEIGIYHKTQCGNIMGGGDSDLSWVYCPHCGKTIETSVV